MKKLVALLIDWPQHIGEAIGWVGPLAARVTVGWVFFSSGWSHLHDPGFVDTFADTGIPWPDLLLPLSSWVELVGVAMTLAGLCTRIVAVPLAINMLVAIRAVLWDRVDTLGDFLILDETAYFVIFVWLAAAGAGALSLDHLLQRFAAPTDGTSRALAP